jgi:3-dehydroquinate synthase
MSALTQEIHVAFRFPVHFTSGVLEVSNPLLKDTLATDQAPARIVFVVDRGVVRGQKNLLAAIKRYCEHFSDRLLLAAPPLVVPGGEKVKNAPRELRRVLRLINDAGICRHSYVVAMGGGAVLDLAGYAAATAHRGVRLIRIPTTVLSQDDSGVGVKNGVNAFGKKNYLGVFAPPFAVINDSRFLATLSDRDWRAGISEAIKGALIKDASFFDYLESIAPRLAARDLDAMEQLVRRCAALHCAHIATSGDPFELGSSRPLDFGHWAAHQLENLTNYRMRHGEAVAVGIALDTTYSYLLGSLSEANWRRILTLLRAVKLPVWVPELEQHLEKPSHPRSVLRGLAEFREHLGGRLTILLLAGIGKAYDVNEIHTDLVARSIGILRDWHTSGTGAPGKRPPLGELENAYAKPERIAR